MNTQLVENVLQFWFPRTLAKDQSTLAHQWLRWFRGTADTEIIEQFSALLERAIAGELDDWSQEPRSRLALIIILDQFSRTIYRGTARAFAQDPKAWALALEGIEIGDYAALETPWEKIFFALPLGHSEDLGHLDLVTRLADELVQEASPDYRPWLEFSASQAYRHREVIARFGRHPHRNEVLGRQSTADELQYLAGSELVHQRSIPLELLKFITE